MIVMNVKIVIIYLTNNIVLTINNIVKVNMKKY